MSPKIAATVVKTAVVLIIIVLALSFFANSMAHPVHRNEQMHCTAGVLLSQGEMIYRDFSYVGQLPYYPLFCAILFKALNTTYYLLTARGFSVVCDILIVLCIIGIYRSVFESFDIEGRLLGAAAAVLYTFNQIVYSNSGFAWSHDVVILCILLSFWLFISADFKKESRYWRIALIASLLTVATCMRINMVLVQLLFLAMLLVQPVDSAGQRFKTTLVFLAAMAAVLVWPVWTLILAPRSFFINVFRIPLLHNKLQQQVGTIYGKLELTLVSLTVPAGILLALVTAYLCVVFVSNRRRLTITRPINLSLAVLLPVIAFIVVLTSPTMYRQYFSMPIPFIIICFAYPILYLRRLNSAIHFKLVGCLMAACVFVAVASYPAALFGITVVLKPQTWTALWVHKTSEQISAKTKDPKLILTLGPLYALEGGCRIYPQFSAGPFVYGVADKMSASELMVTNTVSPKTFKQMLDNAPPSATIVGVEHRSFEQMLIRVGKPRWPEQFYDENIWERKQYHKPWEKKKDRQDLVVYFRR
jgi:4-amino-4-deoxy-L-arabinose transferase-like glycosyltransferase